MRGRGYTVIDVPLSLLVARVAVQTPALILLDIDADGALDVAARLREIPGAQSIDILFRQYQRWRPADRARARTEDDQPSLETRNLDPVTQLRRGLERCLVSYKLDAKHHSHTTHVANAVVLLLQLL